MTEVWDQAQVEQYIIQGIEESLTLDYKAAGSLAKIDDKRTEIAKDVSAMANSAGGIIIYGVAEHNDNARKHLPERIDPIDRAKISKEWLEHIINNIRPKIDGIMIYPVPISTAPNHVVYIVEIPQSYTAHQATDKKYYKRFNFESLAMEDYEIRDVMGRRQYPKIELEFEIDLTLQEVRTGGPSNIGGISIPLPSDKPLTREMVARYECTVTAFNAGKLLAQYINVTVEVPDNLMPRRSDDSDEEPLLRLQHDRECYEKTGKLYCQQSFDNTVRDVIGYEKTAYGSSPPNYGPARHVPILPECRIVLGTIYLTRHFGGIALEQMYIEWETFADNAPPLKRKIAASDIKITDKRT